MSQNNDIERVGIVSAILALVFAATRNYDVAKLGLGDLEFLLAVFADSATPVLGIFFLIYLVMASMSYTRSDFADWSKLKQISYDIGAILSMAVVVLILFFYIIFVLVEFTPNFQYKIQISSLILILGTGLIAILVQRITASINWLK